MPIFPELTLVILLLGSMIIYLLLKFFNSRPKYQLRKEELMEKFQAARQQSKSLQDSLSNYVLSSGADKKLMQDGNSTYGDYLKYLKRNHIQNLSDKEYAKLKNTHNRIQQKKAADMLFEQEQKLEEARKKLDAILA